MGGNLSLGEHWKGGAFGNAAKNMVYPQARGAARCCNCGDGGVGEGKQKSLVKG